MMSGGRADHDPESAGRASRDDAWTCREGSGEYREYQRFGAAAPAALTSPGPGRWSSATDGREEQYRGPASRQGWRTSPAMTDHRGALTREADRHDLRLRRPTPHPAELLAHVPPRRDRPRRDPNIARRRATGSVRCGSPSQDPGCASALPSSIALLMEPVAASVHAAVIMCSLRGEGTCRAASLLWIDEPEPVIEDHTVRDAGAGVHATVPGPGYVVPAAIVVEVGV